MKNKNPQIYSNFSIFYSNLSQTEHKKCFFKKNCKKNVFTLLLLIIEEKNEA
jgi:hypothetical protein